MTRAKSYDPNCESPPPNGWIVELRKASDKLEHSPKSLTASARVVEALYNLRQFKLCISVIQNTFNMIQNKNSTRPSLDYSLELICLRLKQILIDITSQISIQSFVDEEWYQTHVRASILRGKLNIKRINKQIVGSVHFGNIDNMPYYNLNLLQTAAIRGDIRLLEDIISLGAAIDYPIPDLKNEENFTYNSGNYKGRRFAPPGCTALVLTLSFLAMFEKVPGLKESMRMNFPEFEERCSNMEQCAIQLIMLGSDCDAKLILPAEMKDSEESPYKFSDEENDLFAEFRFLEERSVRELAKIGVNPEISLAIEKMGDVKNALQIAHCRCGSRLPWQQCHSANIIHDVLCSKEKILHSGRSSKHKRKKQKSVNKKLLWRVSPLAVCPCGTFKARNYYQCCWALGQPIYLDDNTGRPNKMSFVMKCHSTQNILRQLREITHVDPPGCDSQNGNFPGHSLPTYATSIPTNKTRDTIGNLNLARLYADMIRTGGLHLLSSSLLPQQPKEKSKKKKNDDDSSKKPLYDNRVVAECIERMSDEDVIYWLDSRKSLITDLVEKTKIWENAILSYLNDHDINGRERKKIMMRHASLPVKFVNFNDKMNTSSKTGDDSDNKHAIFKLPKSNYIAAVNTSDKEGKGNIPKLVITDEEIFVQNLV